MRCLRDPDFAHQTMPTYGQQIVCIWAIYKNAKTTILKNNNKFNMIYAGFVWHPPCYS